MEVQTRPRIATDSWRLNRLSAIEDNLFALGLHESGGALCPDHAQIDDALTTAASSRRSRRQLQLLSLYEQRLNRAVQKPRPIAIPPGHPQSPARSDLKEAASLLQLSEMKGLEYTPVKDGFCIFE